MSNLKNKLYNYEATPPADTWEKIASALDESHLSNNFPDRLYNLEIPPPASTWSAIEAGLENTSNTARVIPMRKRAAGFWKYAAAAMLLIVAGYLIVEWTGNKNSAGESTLVVVPDSADNNNTEIVVNTPDETQQPVRDSLIPTSSEVEQPIARTTPSTTATNSSTRRNSQVEERRTDEKPVYASYEPVNMSERYVMLFTPAGNIIRMSKKLGDMVCCVAGEEDDDECRDQIKKWQEKMASSPTTSTGGFMDVLSLVSALDNDL